MFYNLVFVLFCVVVYTIAVALVFLLSPIIALTLCLNQNLMEMIFPRSRRKNGAGKALPYRDPFHYSYKPYRVPE